MRTLVVALLTALLAVPGAAVAEAKSKRAAKHSRATLLTCDTELNAAVFRGSIRTFKKAKGLQLQLRFTLQARTTAGGRFERVVAPSFDEWLTSSPGKRGFVYEKGVQALAAGTTYRAVVRFRWRNAAGRIVARAVKVTPECFQPDDRPNLRATRVQVRPGTSADSRTYLVRIVNRGPVAAPAFAARLAVNGADLPEQMAAPLAARSMTTVAFLSPRCRAGTTLTATVDTGAAVDERNETDNRLAVPCPTRK